MQLPFSPNSLMTKPLPSVFIEDLKSPSPSHPSGAKPFRQDLWAWIAWGLYLAVILILVGFWPDVRNITHHYWDAAQHWWHGQDLYTAHNADGFLYLPQAAVLYLPYSFLPQVPCELLWRITSLGALAWGCWRLVKIVAPETPYGFLLVTLLAIPASLSSARSGQSNMIMGALMIHAAVDLGLKRWNPAALWLCLAFGLKPLAIVMLLLVGALQKEMRLRLFVGLLLLAALGFAHTNQDYVLRQWQLAGEMLTAASGHPENKFCDLGGLLRTIGQPWNYHPSQDLLLSIAAVASLVTLFFCWNLYRRGYDSISTAACILAFSACYLMIFNPRTETNSYVILSPVMALFCLRAVTSGHRKAAWALGLFTFLLGCDSIPRPVHQWTNLWLKALIAIGFMIYLVRETWRGPAPRSSA